MRCLLSIVLVNLRKTVSVFLAFLTLLLALPRPSVGQGAPANLPRVTLPDAADLIYSTRPNDPWNKIFYFLFSRRLTVRLSSDFAEGAPFVDSPTQRKVSTRVFERSEIGDRAIDPMYPTFTVGFGTMLVLHDSAYPAFTQALRDALQENTARSTCARAFMQSDLWGAYDAFFSPFLPDDEKKLGDRRKAALDLIGHLIRKIALTPDEFNSLQENYSSAVRRYSFPDVFAKDSGWIEVAWFLPRAHDDAAGYRRVSRVFLKPAHAPADVHKFLEAQADAPEISVCSRRRRLDNTTAADRLTRKAAARKTDERSPSPAFCPGKRIRHCEGVDTDVRD